MAHQCRNKAIQAEITPKMKMIKTMQTKSKDFMRENRKEYEKIAV